MDDAGIIYRQMPPQPSENIEQEVPDCSPADNPVLFTDNEATYQLVLQVTAEQWVRLFSAATAGADLLYPDTSLDAVFPLRRAVDCMPTFCEAVNECITTVPTIQINMIAIVNFWGEDGEDGENPPVIEVNPVIAEDCDLDILFGACTQLVDLANTAITDVFEVIEAITNLVELANEVLELIPGLNFLASVLDIANVLQEQLAENYAAAYTSTIRDELRCALFCAIRDDCTLDWDAMTQVFADLAGQSILTLDIQDFVEFFTTGTFSGDEVVYASFWFMFGMMSYGGRFLNIDANRLVQISTSFLNDPDPDWLVLCDCGFEWEHEFAGSELQSEFVAYDSRATWSGTGWENGAISTLIQINRITSFTSTNIYSIQVILSDPLASVGRFQFWPGNIGVPGQVEQVSSIWFVDDDLTDFAVGIDNKTGGTYNGEITSIIVKGNGTDPFL